MPEWVNVRPFAIDNYNPPLNNQFTTLIYTFLLNASITNHKHNIVSFMLKFFYL